MKTLIVFLSALFASSPATFAKSLDFSPNHTVTLCGPGDVYFVCQTDQTTQNVWWDFGDGLTGIGFSTMHHYTTEGVYNVKMLVEINGKLDSVVKQSFVTIHPAPQAAFTVARNPAFQPFYRKFVFSGFPNADSVSVFEWKINDSIVASVAQFNYIFPGNGTYQILLTITNNKGCSHSVDTTIEILDDPIGPSALSEVKDADYLCLVSADGRFLNINRRRPVAEQLTVKLFDMTGRLSKEYTFGPCDYQMRIELDSHVPGIVHLYSPGFEQVIKVYPVISIQ